MADGYFLHRSIGVIGAQKEVALQLAGLILVLEGALKGR